MGQVQRLVCAVTPTLPKDAPKVSVNWNPDRIVYVMPDARVGTISNFSRYGLKITDGQVYAHIPVYIYRRAALDRVVREPPCDRELDENIEALRVLDLGYRVEALFVPNVTPTTYEDKLARYD